LNESSNARFFLALKPPPAVSEQLFELAQQVSATGRLHHIDDLHMTLVFLGLANTKKLQRYKKTIGKLSAMCFTLELDVLGFWSKPGIQWCGPSKTPEGLQQLVDKLNQQLAGCGFVPEARIYRPHVTLRRKADPILAHRLEQAIEWPVQNFHLYRSLACGEVRYQRIDSWTLATEPAQAVVRKGVPKNGLADS